MQHKNPHRRVYIGPVGQSILCEFRNGRRFVFCLLVAVAKGLSCAVQFRAADEDNPRGYLELERAERVGQSMEWVQEAQGKAIKLVAHLLPQLPRGQNLRIIFMERPLGEVLAEQSPMLERTGRKGAAVGNARLAETYLKQIAGVRRVLAAHAERIAVLTVSYHDARADPEATAARVNAFLGGAFDERAMAGAVEPSLRRQCIAELSRCSS